MNNQNVTLKQEEMTNNLNNYLIQTYIANGAINVTPKDVLNDLGFNITKNILIDEIMSIDCGLIKNEIDAQCEIVDSNDSLKYQKKVKNKIANFDFSIYENMSITELRTYLIVYNENLKDSIVIGENLIKGKVKRACVAIYTLLKGGTFICYDNSINIIKQIKGLNLNEEEKRNVIEALS